MARHEGLRKSEGTAPLINFGIYGCDGSASILISPGKELPVRTE